MLLMVGSGLVLRFGTAHAASIADMACTSASYESDLTTSLGGHTVAGKTTLTGPGSYAITFDCTHASTIDVTTGASGPGTVVVDTAVTLTITSTGAPVTLSGAGTTQLFQVYFGGSGAGTLNLSNITLAGGSATNMLGLNTDVGGAIYTNGTLNLTSCAFIGNRAIAGGGAIYEDDFGVVSVSGSTFTSNSASGGFTSDGGAIYNTGNLTITDSTFTGNTATGHVGDASTSYTGLPAHGGAIYSNINSASTDTVTVSGSSFTNNSATGGAGADNSPGGAASGGATDDDSGTLTITNSAFSGNSALGGAGGPTTTTSAGAKGGDAGGGAVSVNPDTASATISDSTFVNNTATAGAGGASGMFPVGGSQKVYGTGGSSFGGALNASGGGVGLVTRVPPGAPVELALRFPHSGGGVGLTVTASTFTTNTATGGSGGTGGKGYGGALNVNSSGGGVGLALRIGAAAPVPTTLADNIVYANSASTGGANCVIDPTNLTDNGYNLTNTGDTGCDFSATSDVHTSNAGLGTYANNGGNVPTISLTKTSPALDVIPPNSTTLCGVAGGPLATDARGVSRPQGAGCDIGAYELAPQSVTHLTANPSTATQGQSVQLCATVRGAVSGTGTPTGTVTFKDGGSTLSSGTLAGGEICISIDTLSLGTHSITASYGGDAQFDPSVSSPASVTVGVNGADVAGSPQGTTIGMPPATGGVTGDVGGASGQHAQSASSVGQGTIASASTRQAGTGDGWPASLVMGLGLLLLVGGLGGLGMVLRRAARTSRPAPLP
jgi:hypothetical protein